ncbi:MAG: hypothetical protein MJ217_02160 [Bacilli bacterium]|nr:hypothetical protein [Bacilli bacterium]
MRNTKLIGLATLVLSLGALAACGKPADKPSSKGGDSACKHSWKTETVLVEATCQQKGKEKQKCSKCGATQEVETKTIAHKYVEDKTQGLEATCHSAGKKVEVCSMCQDKKETTLPQTDHVYGKETQVAKDGDNVAYTKAQCNSCDKTKFFWDAGDLTATCKALGDNNVYQNEDGSWRFWGRPIGNDVQLDERGNPNQNNHEAVPNPAQTGNYFEYKFNAPAAMANAKLIANIIPASTINDTDMFAAPDNVTSNDWTYGIKFSGPDDLEGTPIDDFRYVITVNGTVIDLDRANYEGTPSRGEDWYDFPGKFALNQGVNTIRISMAGGWLHGFVNFGVRAAD